MPWRYESVDGKIEVIVEPDFADDLIGLAKSRPVWIVDTQNRLRIDTSWSKGRDADLCEISRCKVEDPDDRDGNLLSILGYLDDHQGAYDIIVHGIEPNKSVEGTLEAEGFRITTATIDGFVALRIPGVRDRLIGRHSP